ncbi:MAG: PKD domain-containing protein, partial [Holophagales bacterium]|nr:PKD domain-containing protein [Holophagales bacterium]
SGSTDSTVTLDASASFDPDGRITAYAWDWESDGTFDETLQTPVAEHAWDLSGTFTVTLRVTNNSGLSSVATTSVTVSRGLSAEPSALKVGLGESSEITVSGGTAPYTALSASPAIASVYMDGETAVVTGVGQGEAAVTIADADGNRTEVLVTAHIPLSVSPTGLTLAEGGSGTVEILSGLPPYSAETDDPGVATASVTGSTVTITAASLFSTGSTVVTVSDAEGTNVDVTVTVDPFTNVTSLVIDEFGEGFTFDFDPAYDAGFGTLVFQVKDQDGLPVNGLSIGNFAVAQNGIPADVESFSDVTEETILKVSLVLDASYSLKANGADEKLKEAADALVEKLGARAEFR